VRNSEEDQLEIPAFLRRQANWSLRFRCYAKLGAPSNRGAYFFESKGFIKIYDPKWVLWELLHTVRKRDFTLPPRRRIFATVQMAEPESGGHLRFRACWYSRHGDITAEIPAAKLRRTMFRQEAQGGQGCRKKWQGWGRQTASGRLPHGIYHPKSGIYHLRYIPWYIPKRKMVYIMVYTIDIYHGIYHYYHGIYHRYIPWYIWWYIPWYIWWYIPCYVSWYIYWYIPPFV
jgi:hypothetical protein